MQLSLEDSCGTHDIRFSGSHQDNWDYIVSDHCVLGTMSQVIWYSRAFQPLGQEMEDTLLSQMSSLLYNRDKAPWAIKKHSTKSLPMNFSISACNAIILYFFRCGKDNTFFFFYYLKREIDSLGWKTLLQSIQKAAGILNENFNNSSQDSIYGFLLYMTNLATLLATAHLSNLNKSQRNCQRKVLFWSKKACMISACFHFGLVFILYSEL